MHKIISNSRDWSMRKILMMMMMMMNKSPLTWR